MRRSRRDNQLRVLSDRVCALVHQTEGRLHQLRAFNHHAVRYDEHIVLDHYTLTPRPSTHVNSPSRPIPSSTSGAGVSASRRRSSGSNSTVAGCGLRANKDTSRDNRSESGPRSPRAATPESTGSLGSDSPPPGSIHHTKPTQPRSDTAPPETPKCGVFAS